MIVTSSLSRIQTVPRPVITIQWNFDQGRRSSRAGTSVSMVSALAVVASLLTAASIPAMPVNQSWQWQLQGKLDPDVPAAVFDVDGFETSDAQVRELHRRGKKVVCYLDVGSWESYRPDHGRFPAAA